MNPPATAANSGLSRGVSGKAGRTLLLALAVLLALSCFREFVVGKPLLSANWLFVTCCTAVVLIALLHAGSVNAFTRGFSRFSIWITAVIVAIMLYEVVMRYVFLKPTLWVNEMSLWLAGMVYLFSGLYAMQKRSHIRITILYDRTPLWLRRLLDVLSTVFVCVFAAMVIYGGFGEAKAKLLRWETFGTAFDPPIPATMKPLVLLVVLILAMQAIANLVLDWNKNAKNSPSCSDN